MQVKDAVKNAAMNAYPALFTVNPATAALGAAVLIACLLVDCAQGAGWELVCMHPCLRACYSRHSYLKA